MIEIADHQLLKASIKMASDMNLNGLILIDSQKIMFYSITTPSSQALYLDITKDKCIQFDITEEEVFQTNFVLLNKIISLSDKQENILFTGFQQDKISVQLKNTDNGRIRKFTIPVYENEMVYADKSNIVLSGHNHYKVATNDFKQILKDFAIFETTKYNFSAKEKHIEPIIVESGQLTEYSSILPVKSVLFEEECLVTMMFEYTKRFSTVLISNDMDLFLHETAPLVIHMEHEQGTIHILQAPREDEEEVE
jgi:hypothetical protein